MEKYIKEFKLTLAVLLGLQFLWGLANLVISASLKGWHYALLDSALFLGLPLTLLLAASSNTNIITTLGRRNLRLTNTIVAALIALGASFSIAGDNTPSGAKLRFTKASPSKGDQQRLIHEDALFRMIGVDFGNSAQPSKPGFYVFRKITNDWIRIESVPTKGATFGRSPTFEEVEKAGATPPSIGWDFRNLAQKAHVELPLSSAGFLFFPDKVESSKTEYELYFGSDWKIKGVETKLKLKIEHLTGLEAKEVSFLGYWVNCEPFVEEKVEKIKQQMKDQGKEPAEIKSATEKYRQSQLGMVFEYTETHASVPNMAQEAPYRIGSFRDGVWEILSGDNFSRRAEFFLRDGLLVAQHSPGIDSFVLRRFRDEEEKKTRLAPIKESAAEAQRVLQAGGLDSSRTIVSCNGRDYAFDYAVASIGVLHDRPGTRTLQISLFDSPPTEADIERILMHGRAKVDTTAGQPIESRLTISIHFKEERVILSKEEIETIHLNAVGLTNPDTYSHALSGAIVKKLSGKFEVGKTVELEIEGKSSSSGGARNFDYVVSLKAKIIADIPARE